MVFLVVSAMTQQFGHSVICFSSFVRISLSRASSRKSLNSLKKSLHVSKGIISLALEESGQLFAQLQSCPQEPALDGRYGEPQSLCRFFCGQFFDVAEYENASIRWLQRLN